MPDRHARRSRSHFHRARSATSVLLIVLALVAAACREGEDGEGGGEAGGVITFGTSLSLTGDTATEGRLVRDGYDFMVDTINEAGGIEVGDQTYTVEIKYYDDQSDADQAVRLYEKLIVEDEVDFLLGPYSSGTTLPVSAVSERHKIPMVVAHAASTPIYEQGFEYLFATLTDVAQYTGPMLEMATTLDPSVETLALINENDLFPQVGIDGAARQAEELGIEVVYKEKYPTGTKDLSSLLSEVKSLEPDMLIAGGYTGDMILLERQAEEVGLAVPLTGYLLGPTLPGFVEDLGDRAENLLEPIQWDPTLQWEDQFFGWTAQEFAELFEEEFGYSPDYHPPQSAAALEVYMDALQRAGTLDHDAVRDAIAETDIMTFYGPVRFNEQGQNIAKGMSVIQIQDGAPTIVWPEDVRQSDLIYPDET
jgi:branched-chain amino acid transport system substrate-binding protein